VCGVHSGPRFPSPRGQDGMPSGTTGAPGSSSRSIPPGQLTPSSASTTGRRWGTTRKRTGEVRRSFNGRSALYSGTSGALQLRELHHDWSPGDDRRQFHDAIMAAARCDRAGRVRLKARSPARLQAECGSRVAGRQCGHAITSEPATIRARRRPAARSAAPEKTPPGRSRRPAQLVDRRDAEASRAAARENSRARTAGGRADSPGTAGSCVRMTNWAVGSRRTRSTR